MQGMTSVASPRERCCQRERVKDDLLLWGERADERGAPSPNNGTLRFGLQKQFNTHSE